MHSSKSVGHHQHHWYLRWYAGEVQHGQLIMNQVLPSVRQYLVYFLRSESEAGGRETTTIQMMTSVHFLVGWVDSCSVSLSLAECFERYVGGRVYNSRQASNYIVPETSVSPLELPCLRRVRMPQSAVSQSRRRDFILL
jgi:hypothetical protein